MILNFKIKNFTSIKDEVVLDLRASSDNTLKEQAVFEGEGKAFLKATAIYGPNASGKSNVLKAFTVFRAMILESLLRSTLKSDLPNRFFKLSSETIDKPSFFEVEFLIDDKVHIYGFEIDKQKICAEWLRQKKGKKNLFKRVGQEINSNRYFKEATATLKKQTAENVLFLTLLASNNGKLSQKIIEFFRNTNYVSGTQRGSTLGFSIDRFMESDQLAEKIKKLIIMADFGVVDIEASKTMMIAGDIDDIPDKLKQIIFAENSQVTAPQLKFYHELFDGKQKSVEKVALDFFSEESEGTRQMFALAAPIIDTLEKGKVLFIDEIDASLHPILCQYIVALFNSKEKNPHNAQLIFTTHDVSLLKNDLLRRDQIYFTEKNKYGATQLFSLADISERKGLDYAKRYLEGRYDALPYISDYENLKVSR